MSDESNTPTPDTVPQPRPAAPSGNAVLDQVRAENELNSLRSSLRAVTQERSSLKERLSALESELETLRPFKAKAEELEGQFNSYKQESGHQLSLAEMGITSQRARRALLREYKDDTADLPAEERPTLTDWANSVKDDPFFSRFFPAAGAAQEAAAEEEDKGTQQRQQRPPPKGADGDPNAGTKGSDKGSGAAKKLDADDWRRERAQSGGRLGKKTLEERLAALKAQGVIS